MSEIAYYNGCLFEKGEVKIPISDRALFFGDAVYDVMVGQMGRIHQAYEHIERLLYGACAIELNHPYSADMLFDLISDLVKKSSLSHYKIYIQLSRTAKERNHSFRSAEGCGLLIMIDSFELNKELNPIKLITVEDKRYRFCNIKTINLLPAVLASTAAEERGCEEAVFHRGSIVTECSHSNISIICNDILYTHPLSDLILPGITRKHLLEGAKSMGLVCRQEPFTLSDLYSANEVLITSTTKLLRVASEIDTIKVGGRARACADALFRFLLDEYEGKIP